MRITSLLTLATLSALMKADGISDFNNLQSKISDVSTQILNTVKSVNATMLVNGTNESGELNISYHIAQADPYVSG